MNIFKRIRNLFSFGSDNVPKGVNPEHVEACRRIVKHGTCNGANVSCRTERKGCTRCPNMGKYYHEGGWYCGDEKSIENNARKWLAKHGIKE